MLKRIKNINHKYKKLFIILLIISSILIIYNVFFKNSVAMALSRYGSTGSEVKQIQTNLKKWGYYTGAIDGVYGSQTVAAVKYFQSKNGLTADGIAGTRTLQALGINTSSTSSSSINTSSNANLMAHLIYAEARGEPYAGQVAIGAVVLNRVKSSLFPNTIAGVIYQPGAFTPVSDGQINLAPNTSAQNAARDALNGWDPSYGSLYYFNPRTTTNQWIWSRPYVITIGNHRFCK